MEPLSPLHERTVQKHTALLHQTHTILHSTALSAIIHYRIASFFYPVDNAAIIIPLLPWLLILSSELFLSFIWLLSAAFLWRPISRTAYPERLPPDDELPPIDVFICTADPKKEPPLEVMNTLISAMALDYPPDKLSVYLSDDGGSSLTLYAVREGWNFANCWVRFCRRFGIQTRCPKAYFETSHGIDHGNGGGGSEFVEERHKIEEEYLKFKERLEVGIRKEEIMYTGGSNPGIRPPVVQVIGERGSNDTEMPFLVYVSREKRSSRSHHFKAGALNVLLRVSAILSNSPYILVLDCDMYSNDPSSARRAMCFHLDPQISSSLAFVQFPQKFHNISKNDIYDASLRSVFEIKWPGMDGLRGPMLSGTCFYIKREALYGCSTKDKDGDLALLKESFGSSSQLLKSLNNYSRGHNAIRNQELVDAMHKEAEFVASCTYEDDTQWGKLIGLLYDSVVEDFFTGFKNLHCRGWTSVYCNPQKPAFLGSATTNLSDTIIQGTRWNSGLLEVFLSRSCPLIYGIMRLPLLDCMCYAYLALQPLYSFPVWCLGIVPQLCLLRSIPVYPQVSSRWFIVYSCAFLSPLAKHLYEVRRTGGTIQVWWNEWRVWMIKSVTAYLYGSLDAILKLVGIAEASFLPTNKVADDEQVKRYQMDVYDFQAPTMLLTPLVTLVLLNMVCFIWGTSLAIYGVGAAWKQLFGQILVSGFILVVCYPIIEGMLFRKDKGRIPPQVTLLSSAFALLILLFNNFL